MVIGKGMGSTNSNGDRHRHKQYHGVRARVKIGGSEVHIQGSPQSITAWFKSELLGNRLSNSCRIRLEEVTRNMNGSGGIG